MTPAVLIAGGLVADGTGAEPIARDVLVPIMLALALVSFAGCALLAWGAVLIAWACTEGDDGYEGHHQDDY